MSQSSHSAARNFRGFFLALAAFGAILVSPVLRAAEYPFGYIYTTDTQPKGRFEVEQWVTTQRGQSRGDYSNMQYRTELEYGVTDNFQASIYANYNSVNAFANNPDGTTGGRFVPDDADPAARYKASFYDSTSLEFIWRLMSPYKDAFGLALYLEPTYGPKRKELEGKLIVDKNFLDDQLVWAANLVAAQEQEKYPGEWEKEAEIQVLTGLSYRFAPRWSAALEYRYVRGYFGNTWSASNREFAAHFLGPTLHYADKRWWVTLSWLPQLSGAKGYTADAAENVIDGRFYKESFARNEFRIRAGFSF
ncbi:MAG: hypothetical protein K2Y35_21680 [Burkholderiales bacterium]|nr:hypothetical protein [Burkholderiales bacterium]